MASELTSQTPANFFILYASAIQRVFGQYAIRIIEDIQLQLKLIKSSCGYILARQNQ